MVIFVHMIDGTEAWAPVLAREVATGVHEILDSETFDPDDTTTLMQFIPGDVVRLRDNRAVELVSSSYADREYWSTLYRIVSGEPPSEPDATVAKRIVSEVKAKSRPHYRAVVEWALERV